MGTAKRERQKANRALKLEQQAKQERVEKVKRTSTRWLLTIGGLVLVIVALLWATGSLGGDDTDATSDASATATDSLGPDSPVVSAAPVTFPPIDKPEVSLPAAAPTELKVTELRPGEGPEAATGDTVEVYYVGVTSDEGVEFDNSYDSGRAFPVTLGTDVIEGWSQGLVGVQAGGQYQLDIPPELAYGEAGSPPAIGPNQALTFVVDVLSVTPAGN